MKRVKQVKSVLRLIWQSVISCKITDKLQKAGFKLNHQPTKLTKQYAATLRFTSDTKHRLVPNLLSTSLNRLQRSSGLRGSAYIGTCGLLRYIAPSPLPITGVWSSAVDTVYVGATAFGVTWLFSKLGNDQYFHWHAHDLPQNLHKFSIGVLLGAGQFGALVIVARAFGWVSFSGWGWERTSSIAVISVLTARAAEYLAVGFMEELVFRGYALQTLRPALGMPLAATLLTASFALAHGTEPQSLVGQSASGLMFMMLRLATGSTWMSIGCHFALGYAQTGLLGPTDGPPSLLPMHNHGPKKWLGRPGYPEPGLLITIIYLLVATCTTFVWYNRQKRSKVT